MRIVPVLLVNLLLLSACRSSSREDILADAPAVSETPGVVYERPEGVTFHIPAILGMQYTRFQGSEMEAYLGQRLEETKLPGVRGREVRYGQGVLGVGRDTIYYVRYDYPKPVTRDGALHFVGLPESMMSEMKSLAVSQWIEHSTYGYRRIVLTRTEPGVDTYVRIEAWKFLPGEKF